jgi:hypothetical protein
MCTVSLSIVGSHPFKQRAQLDTQWIDTAKPSNNVRIQRCTQLALPNTQTVRSHKFNRLALPSNPSAQPATQSFSIAIHSNNETSNRLPDTQSVGTDITSNNVHSRRLNRFHSHPFNYCSQPDAQSVDTGSYSNNVHRQPLNRHGNPFTVHRQPLRQLAVTSIQTKYGTTVCQSDDTIIKSIKRYGSPSLGTVLYRGSGGVPRSLEPGANNDSGRP